VNVYDCERVPFASDAHDVAAPEDKTGADGVTSTLTVLEVTAVLTQPVVVFVIVQVAERLPAAFEVFSVMKF
jgi:hypothetical protein